MECLFIYNVRLSRTPPKPIYDQPYMHFSVRAATASIDMRGRDRAQMIDDDNGNDDGADDYFIILTD